MGRTRQKWPVKRDLDGGVRRCGRGQSEGGDRGGERGGVGGTRNRSGQLVRADDEDRAGSSTPRRTVDSGGDDVAHDDRAGDLSDCEGRSQRRHEARRLRAGHVACASSMPTIVTTMNVPPTRSPASMTADDAGPDDRQRDAEAPSRGGSRSTGGALVMRASQAAVERRSHRCEPEDRPRPAEDRRIDDDLLRHDREESGRRCTRSRTLRNRRRAGLTRGPRGPRAIRRHGGVRRPIALSSRNTGHTPTERTSATSAERRPCARRAGARVHERQTQRAREHDARADAREDRVAQPGRPSAPSRSRPQADTLMSTHALATPAIARRTIQTTR